MPQWRPRLAATGSAHPPLSAPAPASANPQSGSASPPSRGRAQARRKLSPLREKIAAHLVNAQHTATILIEPFNERLHMSTVMGARLRAGGKTTSVKKHGEAIFTVVFHQGGGRCAQTRARHQRPDGRRRHLHPESFLRYRRRGWHGQGTGRPRCCEIVTRGPSPASSSSTLPLREEGARRKAADQRSHRRRLHGLQRCRHLRFADGHAHLRILREAAFLGFYNIVQRLVAVDGKVEIWTDDVPSP